MKKEFLVCLIVCIFLISGCQEGELKLVPKEKMTGQAVGVAGTEVGTGWSTNENPGQAIQEAVNMALEGKINGIRFN